MKQNNKSSILEYLKDKSEIPLWFKFIDATLVQVS